MNKKEEELTDLANPGLNEDGGKALAYLQSDDCLVPFFKSLSAANIFRIGVAYAIKEKMTPATSKEIGKTGSTGEKSFGLSWAANTGATLNGFSGKPEVYRLLEIISKKGYVENPNRLLEGYAHVGLISLAERVKSGENLNKIFD
jgi:hypothetical protein